MRTTLDIDDDLLAAAKELARRERKSAGQIVSELMRKGLTAGSGYAMDAGKAASSSAIAEQAASYGLHPFPPGDVVATNDQVNRLREELGI